MLNFFSNPRNTKLFIINYYEFLEVFGSDINKRNLDKINKLIIY